MVMSRQQSDYVHFSWQLGWLGGSHSPFRPPSLAFVGPYVESSRLHSGLALALPLRGQCAPWTRLFAALFARGAVRGLRRPRCAFTLQRLPPPSKRFSALTKRSSRSKSNWEGIVPRPARYAAITPWSCT